MERAQLRSMRPEDIGEAAPLLAGRNVDEHEYRRFLALEGAHGLVLELDGKPIAGATAIRYFDHGFVGPALLAPGVEGAGAPLALLSRAVEGLLRSGVAFVEAEASATDAKILSSIGFREVRETLVLERPPAAPPAKGKTRAMTHADLLDVGSLDASAVGHGRKEYLAALRDEMPEAARVVEDAEDVTGFALLRRSRRGFHVGPLVTRVDDREAAGALLRDAIAPATTHTVVALAPEGNGLADVMPATGFRPVGRLVRMRAGERPPVEGKAVEWLVGSRITG